MLYAGVKDVRILNGGIRSWEDAGYEITTEPSPNLPRGEFGITLPGRPELVSDVPEAKAILASDRANLVSVRSWPEYIGETSGYNYIEKKGRIPGSVFGNCGTDAYHMENYRNLDHTTREFHEIAEIWEEVGIVPDKHNAFYCGTGWRGSEAWFNAWLMGWASISVFDGGWFEWSADPSNPIETGIPA
jgi:thiosulfate/3-mercaptopyruvate sulfurtransferase